MSEEIFRGFTPQTVTFFKELGENNYKEWFEDHRSVYENDVLKPLRALVTALAPTMHNIDPEFELRPTKVLSRIYRDIRFSKDKTPYKDHMWISFQKPISRDEWQNYPGYFIEIGATGYHLGMGLFMANKKVMDYVKDSIKYDAEEFKRMTQKTVLNNGFEIRGEDYKRPVANDLDPYFQPWIQKKSFWVAKNKPINDEFFTSDLVEQIRTDFVALEWLYNFLKESQP